MTYNQVYNPANRSILQKIASISKQAKPLFTAKQLAMARQSLKDTAKKKPAVSSQPELNGRYGEGPNFNNKDIFIDGNSGRIGGSTNSARTKAEQKSSQALGGGYNKEPNFAAPNLNSDGNAGRSSGGFFRDTWNKAKNYWYGPQGEAVGEAASAIGSHADKIARYKQLISQLHGPSRTLANIGLSMQQHPGTWGVGATGAAGSTGLLWALLSERAEQAQRKRDRQYERMGFFQGLGSKGRGSNDWRYWNNVFNYE